MVHRTSNLWNDLPPHAFPPTYNLQTFNSSVSRHLDHCGSWLGPLIHIFLSFPVGGGIFAGIVVPWASLPCIKNIIQTVCANLSSCFSVTRTFPSSFFLCISAYNYTVYAYLSIYLPFSIFLFDFSLITLLSVNLSHKSLPSSLCACLSICCICYLFFWDKLVRQIPDLAQ